MICNKIGLVTFATNSICGHNNLCHLSCDSITTIEKKKNFIIVAKIYNMYLLTFEIYTHV
jgi:hypothetical protein